jgi:hypothetical protein
VLAGQRRAEPGIARLPQFRYRPLLPRLGDLAVGATAAQPMQNPPISLLAQTLLPTPHLAVAHPQPPRGFDLLDVSFFHLLQHL